MRFTIFFFSDFDFFANLQGRSGRFSNLALWRELEKNAAILNCADFLLCQMWNKHFFFFFFLIWVGSINSILYVFVLTVCLCLGEISKEATEHVN